MQSIESSNQSQTVGATLSALVHHPAKNLLRRWNWKAAILSALVRGTLFFTTNLRSGLDEAIGAMLLEAAFYISVAGFYGALIESFRRVRPEWMATLTVMGLLPAINHSLELALHAIAGTEQLTLSILASVLFSMFSAAFNLFAMRRGALIIGEERSSLFSDLLRLPGLLLEFMLAIPRMLLGKEEKEG